MRADKTGAALDLLERARVTLVAGSRAASTDDRYIEAHLGALRAGAALLAVRGPRRSGVSDLWSCLRVLAPELGEWSDYFAFCGRRRACFERGEDRASAREADDLLRAAETFLGLVQAALGLPVTRIGSELAVAGHP